MSGRGLPSDRGRTRNRVAYQWRSLELWPLCGVQIQNRSFILNLVFVFDTDFVPWTEKRGLE